jgi:hypothetical protein
VIPGTNAAILRHGGRRASRTNMEKRGVDNLRASFSESPDDVLTPVEETTLVHSGFWVSVSGTRFYGRVDVVPYYLAVETKFWHLFWIPLIPLEGWIIAVDSEGRDPVKHVPIELSWKSIGFTWLRILVYVGLVAEVIFVLNLLLRPDRFDDPLQLFMAVILAGCFAFFAWQFRYWALASKERAVQLANRVGFAPDRKEEILDALAAMREGRPEREPVEVSCPKCGQKVLETTKICPRCERRL